MRTQDLERIRQKVEAGDVLSREEFDSLEQFSRIENHPWLKVTIAQALINADQPQAAISRLETVRRDFPHDTQAHLAYARAMILLDRWADAEQPLRQVLTLQPRDPEALKTLALLAMRRAEFQRARGLIAEALAEDPLDGEAQQLLSELDAQTTATTTRMVSMPDFTQALINRLKQQSTPHLLQKEHLLVRLGKGGVARVDLKSLYSGHLDSGRSLDGTVQSIAEELAERSLGVPPGKDGLLAQVLPVIRDPAFIEQALGAVSREGPAGLHFFYVLEDPELVRYVPQGVLLSHGVSLEELDHHAWQNLNARPAALRALEMEEGALQLSPTPTGLWAFAQGDGHDSARLLTDAHQQAIRAQLGDVAVRTYLGLRELVLLCREDDQKWLSRLNELDAGREGIRGHFRLQAGRLLSVSDWAGV